VGCVAARRRVGHCTWDDENRRTRVILPSNLVNTFSYNGDGLRFEQQTSSGIVRTVWDGEAYLAGRRKGDAARY